MGVLRYSTNNSGGSWWLSDKDWEALEQAGWVVHWIHDINATDHIHQNPESHGAGFGGHSHSYADSTTPAVRSGDNFIGALATSCAIETDNPDEAVRQFEVIAGQNADDEGCNCCGPPHSFSFVDDSGNEKYLSSEVVSRSYERGWW